jgi:hypothetical protein
MTDLSYTVWAYSPTLNQEQRCFLMENLKPNEAQAHDQATNFARRMNEQRNQHVQDWQPRVKHEPVGAKTLPNWAFNSLTQDIVTHPGPIV